MVPPAELPEVPVSDAPILEPRIGALVPSVFGTLRARDGVTRPTVVSTAPQPLSEPRLLGSPL